MSHSDHDHQQHTASPGAEAPGERAATRGPAAPTAGNGFAAGADAGVPAPAPESGENGQTGETEVELDLDALVKKAGQRDEYLALAQRTQADFENYRKRMAREAAAAQERGVSALAKELLPALDNLDRALENAATDDPLLDGIRLVRSELAAALARVGIESFRPVGEVFDPSLHDAVATAPSPDPATLAPGAQAPASGTVVEVYQDGYRLRDSVIRPARVIVAA